MNFIKIAQARIYDDAPRISSLLVNVLEFLLSIFGILAIISIVISGIMYVMAAGDEEMIKKAKKMTFYSVVAAVIALGSLIIIRTISGFF